MQEHKFPYPSRYGCGTGAGWVFSKYFFGGPLEPNTSIVINVPVLQQGHLRKWVCGGAVGRVTCSAVCSACSLPRFQLLLRMP